MMKWDVCSYDAMQNNELEKLFHEEDQHGDLMKTIWFKDREWQKKEFC